MGVKEKVVEWLMPSFIDTLVKDLSDPSTSKHMRDLEQRLPGTINKKKVKKAPKQVGSQGWNDPSLELGPSGWEKFIYDFAVPAVGDVAKVAGNAYGAYNNLLGGALAAMANGEGSKRSGILPDYNKLSLIPAAAFTTKGTIGKLIGDTVANRAYTFADTSKAENIEKRKAQFERNEHPVGTYYARQNAMTKVPASGIPSSSVK